MSGTSDPTIPSDLLASLGLESGDVGPSSSLPPASGLDEVRARIAADLVDRQGPWRARSTIAKVAPFAVAFVIGLLLFVVLRPAPGALVTKVLASVLAALSGVAALVAVALAPARPALGERLALGALSIGAVALVVEGWLASAMPTDIDLGLVCFAVTLAGGLVPVAIVTATLRASGLPVRRLHALAATTAGLALAGAAVWLHCPAERLFHLVVGHMALLVIALVVVGVLLSRWLTRQSRRG
jgi:hypothetical protein